MHDPRKIGFTVQQYEEFIEYIKENHRGIQKAVKSKDMEKALDIKGIQVRIMKHHGVTERCELIGATTESGYFYIETQEELHRCINDAQSRISSLKELIEGYKEAWKFRNGNAI